MVKKTPIPNARRWSETASPASAIITPAGAILDERTYVNGLVGLMATGGSTNLVLHLPAMARASGVLLDLEDFSDISDVTPLMAKVYPNGLADVNHFHAAGGLAFMIGELLDAGLLHPDTETVAGKGLAEDHVGVAGGGVVGLRAVGRDLDRPVALAAADGAEVATDVPHRVGPAPDQPLDLVGARGRRQVEIGVGPSEQRVAHRPTHERQGVAGVGEPSRQRVDDRADPVELRGDPRLGLGHAERRARSRRLRGRGGRGHGRRL